MVYVLGRFEGFQVVTYGVLGPVGLANRTDGARSLKRAKCHADSNLAAPGVRFNEEIAPQKRSASAVCCTFQSSKGVCDEKIFCSYFRGRTAICR